MRKLIESTVNRLRLCQVECAALDEEIRRRRLDQAVGEAVRGVAPRDRRTFITRLLEQFPIWEEPVDAAPAIRSTFDQTLLDNPDFLTARLARLLADMSDERKKAIASELNRAGLPSVGQPAWPPRSSSQLRRSLRAAGESKLDADRVLEVLTLLSNLTLDLDDIAWMTWHDLAEGELPVPRGEELRTAIARCLTGDAETPASLVASGVDRIRQMLGHLISAIPLVGRFAAAHIQHFSPAEIRNSLKWEKRQGWFESDSVRAWRKYESLSRTFDEEAFSSAIRSALADQLNRWVRGACVKSVSPAPLPFDMAETKASL